MSLLPAAPFSHISLLALCALLLTLATGCNDLASADESGTQAPRSPYNNSNGAPTGGAGVGQSGAQDFGRFRSIIDGGEVPAPNTLDAVGFFNEHKFELPAPDCGGNVCPHGMFGVWGNMLNGANCTLAMLGFNTPLDPADFERPPLNMAIAVDTSGSIKGQPLDMVIVGLKELARKLSPKDEVTLIAYSNEARVLIESTPESDPDRSKLTAAIESLEADGFTNMYDGLKSALEAVSARKSASRQNRVILLSDGVATRGIQNRDRIINLGATYASQGIGITTIGVGTEFDIELMQRLSETGSGNFYFVENLNTVDEIFGVEADTFLVPVAEDVTINFDVAKGYRFRAAYGTRTWEGDADGATLSIPSLFIASRKSIDDIDPGGGRRGGGGAILFEVVPTSDVSERESVPAGQPIGQVTMSYRQPGTQNMVSTETTILNELPPGDTPAGGAFDSAMVEKAFVALNIYAGFDMALDRYASGAPNQAIDILVPLEQSVGEWLSENEDEDIESDLRTLNQLIRVMRSEGARQSTDRPMPPSPWPQD